MNVGNYLSMLTTPELKHIKTELNLTDEENLIFDCLSRKQSINEMSMILRMSTRTVDRYISRIKQKLNKLI